MEKNEEKVLEGEVVIKKIDSEGFIYYESLNNASEPNWENLNIFLQNLPVKELIIGTVVFSILLLLPNVSWAKLKPSKMEQEQLIKGRAFLDAARQKRVQDKIILKNLKEAKKVVSMKKIIMWNEKLVEFEPTTSIIKYILHFVSGQVHSFRQDKINRLALIQEAKKLAEQQILNDRLSILLRINGGFIGFNVILQIVEKGKKIMQYFEKNPYRKSKKEDQNDDRDFLLWKNINVTGLLIALLLLIRLYLSGDCEDLDDPFLQRKQKSLHYLVFKLFKIMLKKKNRIISFIKSKPVLFTITIGSVVISAALIIIGEQDQELKVLRAIIKDAETEKQQQLTEEKNIIDVPQSKSE